MSSKDAVENAPAKPVRRPWSLAARLTAWYAGSAFLLILGATGFLYWVLSTNLDREDDQFLADKVHLLRKLLRERPDGIKSIEREAEEEWAARQYAQVFVRILDTSGRSLLETPGMSKELTTEVFPQATAIDAEPGRAREIETASGKTFLLLAVQAHVGRSGPESRLIQLAFDRTYEEQLLAGYRRNLWLVLGIALVACALGGYHIARRGLRPVADITATARQVRATTLDARIEAARFPAELATLAATFNEMLDRLEESFHRLARFSADIAHELRTPVNNIRGEAEVALGKERPSEEYREVLGSCLEECVRLTRLIDSLLFLARAESPQTQIVKETIDVGRELSLVRDFYEAAASEAGIKLQVIAPDGLDAEIDRTLFQRAVGNLIANAIAHTAANGAIELAANRSGDRIQIEVSDSGCGIAPEHLPYVFDRFYRVDQARANSSARVGLGLAIVKSIATLHGGTVSIASAPQQGTRVTISLPGRQTASADA
ncbi:MAG TPA: heavy metal sensor histidine kinase [Gemmataceae bacterium]|jgi:two-component system heavy metal sensor histidine kinase CusS|nr:heavy metal sensor histidine kinase [Gemmataceae bacterium]